jgi:mRNA interferase RelE/StbE
MFEGGLGSARASRAVVDALVHHTIARHRAMFLSDSRTTRGGARRLRPRGRGRTHARRVCYPGIQQHLQRKIDELGRNGRNARGFSHHRMQGVEAFRMRVGDYRVIYQFNVEKNALILITVGHRRDIYKTTSN